MRVPPLLPLLVVCLDETVYNMRFYAAIHRSIKPAA